jgi:Uncharacterized alpha/beta hydrolase domain (DUF2235)
MKRIVFCFDGTWNKLAADTPTNVVLTAASIQRVAADGRTQIIHYDEGVGTGRLERWSGGLFAVGLVANMREAYRFLIFNYDPRDEIYVFGFSRGAFTARTLSGCCAMPGRSAGCTPTGSTRRWRSTSGGKKGRTATARKCARFARAIRARFVSGRPTTPGAPATSRPMSPTARRR